MNAWIWMWACAAPVTGGGDGQAEGAATWQDAETEPDGEPRAADSPDAQTFFVEVTLDGTGSFTVTEPECQLDGTAFTALYAGEATLDADGLYVASLTQVSAETPSGCTLPELQVSAVTNVVVRGELDATSENCTSHCQAEGRAEAEAACSGDDDQAGCRSELEAQFQGECQTECTTEATSIVAETSLGIEGVAAVSEDMVSGTGLGALSVDLTFDQRESDGQGL